MLCSRKGRFEGLETKDKDKCFSAEESSNGEILPEYDTPSSAGP